jgi:deoxyadenosine/deoxycytidine kinase
VEGCIGVGKTTWAQALANARQACLVLEAFDKNPFLPAFYADPVGNALETELQFLLMHYHQLKQFSQRADEALETITDFTLFKDTIFADTNLSDPGDKGMFDVLYNFLSAKLRAPDLVIYLQGSDNLILERVCQRSRSMEMQIDTAYFVRLNRAYEKFFSRFNGPVRVINADLLDCIKRPEALQEVLQVIDAALVLHPATDVPPSRRER